MHVAAGEVHTKVLPGAKFSGADHGFRFSRVWRDASTMFNQNDDGERGELHKMMFEATGREPTTVASSTSTNKFLWIIDAGQWNVFIIKWAC